MIQVSAVTKSFGLRDLWSELSFEVPSGRTVALVGPSGSGKSTLLNCLGLLETVDAGTIVVDGRQITGLRAGARRRFRRDRLGYLFQNYALVENATVDLNLGLAVGAVPRRRRPGRPVLAEALERVGMGGRGSEPVYQLSGGEQQRVALARLIVKRPSVVLADEPTGALDRVNGAMVIEVLAELAAQGCSVVIATHNDDVAGACDEVVDLGTLTKVGSVDAQLASP